MTQTVHQGGAAVDPIQRLILELARLPGIGERTAARLAFYIIKTSGIRREPRAEGSQEGRAPADGTRGALARDLAAALIEVADTVGLCRICQNLCTGGRCGICADARRDRALLCVVEGIADLRALESSGAYRGTYHVLHGALAPLDGVGPDELRLDEVVRRVREQECTEVILATNADVEGDATALYLAQLLRPIGVTISRIASGIPMGGELEYIDQATLSRALAERRSIF